MLLVFIETIICVVSLPFVFSSYGIIQPQITPKVAAPKVSKGRSESPLVASAEAKPLHDKHKSMRKSDSRKNPQKK
jgi:hypothetical protein